jgi:hypothetical protein
MIELFDRIVLTGDLPDKHLEQGDVGTIVMVYNNGEGYEVEFFTLSGATYRVETLSASLVRPVQKDEVTHMRKVS